MVVSRQARRAQGFVQPTLRHTDPGEKDHGGKLYNSGPITEAAVLLEPIRLVRRRGCKQEFHPDRSGEKKNDSCSPYRKER